MSDEGATPPKRRRIWRWIAVPLVILVALIVAIASGIPQTYVLKEAVESASGGIAEVGGVDIIGNPSIGYFRLYDDAVSSAAHEAAFEVEGARAEMNWRGSSGRGTRYVKRVEIDRVALQLIRRADGDSTYDFAVPPSGGGSESEGVSWTALLPYLPEVAIVKQADLHYSTPASEFKLQNVELSGEIDSERQWRFGIAAKDAVGRYRMTEPSIENDFDDAAIDIGFSRSGTDWSLLPMNVKLPGFADIAGRLTFDIEALQSGANLDLDTFRIEAFELDASQLVPVAFGFDSLEGSGSKLRIRVVSFSSPLFGSDFDMTAKALRIGPKEQPLFAADTRVRVETVETTVTAMIDVGEELSLSAGIQGGVFGGKVHLENNSWRAASVYGVAPFARAVLPLAIADETIVDLKGTIGWTGMNINITGDVSLTPANTPPLEVSVRRVPQSNPNVRMPDWQINLRQDEGTASTTIAVDELGSMVIDANMAGFPIASAFTAFDLDLGEGLLPGVVDGVVRTTYDVGVIESDVDLDVTRWPLMQGIAEMASLSGTVVYNTELQRALIEEARLHGGAIDIAMSDLSVDTGEMTAQGAYEGQIALGDLDESIRPPGLDGSLEMDGTLRYADSAVDTGGTLALTGMKYGELDMGAVAPAATYTMNMRTGSESVQIALSDVRIADLDVQIEPFDFAFSPAAFDTKFEAAGTLSVLKKLGYVASAEGELALTGQLGLNEDGMQIVLPQARVESTVIELPDEMARFAGVTAEVTGTIGAASEVAGPYAIARADSMGVAITDVRGNLTYDGGQLAAAIVEGAVFGGRLLKGQVTIDLAGEAPAIRVDTQIRNADLARFTEEFNPPGTKLTGIVSGYVRATFADGILQEADVMLRAADGFSINKDVLRAPLEAQAQGNPALQVLLRTWESDDELEQREFEAATLTAKAEPGGGHVTGEANFISEDLRVALPLRIDTRVITRALDQQQQRLLGNVEGLRIAPPEL